MIAARELIRTPAPRKRSRWLFETHDEYAASCVRSSLASILATLGAQGDELVRADVVFDSLVGDAMRNASGMIEVIVDCTLPSPTLHVLDGRVRAAGQSHPSAVLLARR